MLNVGFKESKRMFFSVDTVLKQMDRVTLTALNRAGGWIRKTAQRSMRRRKKASAPGEPPSAHAGQLRDLLFYVWYSSSRSVLVGPGPFGGAKSAGQKPRPPARLEGGGTTTLQGRRGQRRSARFQARPYMGPALELAIAQNKIADQYRNTIAGP